jgi:lipopolysaccharide export LptBFGC system permease protein LptF
MEALFVRGLASAHSEGTVARWRAGFSALLDVARRGVYERALDERAAWQQGGAGTMRRVAGMYALSLFVLTDLMLVMHVSRMYPRWQANGLAPSTMAELFLWAVPFTLALTVPMAVLLAVLLAGRQRGVPQAPLRSVPVFVSFGVLALGAFVLVAEVVPRANARLLRVEYGPTVSPENDRSLTLSQLQVQSQQLRADIARGGTGGASVASMRASAERLAAYQVEMHKKGALAAACVVFALLALGVSRRAPRVNLLGAVLVSGVVFVAYYSCLTVGETAADLHLISPALAMWGANVLFTLLAVGLLRGSRGQAGTQPPEPLIAA